jgi:hypothetical protein
MLVATIADRQVAPARHGAKKLEETHVSRAVRLGDARDTHRDLLAEAARDDLGLELGAAVEIVGGERARLIERS